MISFISIAPAMTGEVIIITRQYFNYNPLYSLAPSEIITSKRRDQPSSFVNVALFILEKTTLFKVTTTPSLIALKLFLQDNYAFRIIYGKCPRLAGLETETF